MDMATSVPAAMAAGASELLRPADQRIRRARPADFEAIAPGLSQHALSLHYSANWRTVARWLEEVGLKSKGHAARGLAPPPDLAERAVASHPAALCRHYGVANTVVTRWLRQAGITPAKPPIAGQAIGRPAPQGFALVAPGKTLAGLCKHYSANRSTVTRWLTLAGVKPAIGRRWGHAPAKSGPSVPSDVASQAAQHLRRFHSAVYSSSILTPAERARLPDQRKGLYFVSGKGHIPADQMVAMAEAKGFDSRAWARI